MAVCVYHKSNLLHLHHHYSYYYYHYYYYYCYYYSCVASSDLTSSCGAVPLVLEYCQLRKEYQQAVSSISCIVKTCFLLECVEKVKTHASENC